MLAAGSGTSGVASAGAGARRALTASAGTSTRLARRSEKDMDLPFWVEVTRLRASVARGASPMREIGGLERSLAVPLCMCEARRPDVGEERALTEEARSPPTSDRQVRARA